MADKDLPSEALDKIIEQGELILKKTTFKLYNDLKEASPVGTPESTGIKGYVGGNFRDSWTPPKRIGKGWLIKNTAEYATILARGRRFVENRLGSSTWKGARWIGSKQWQHGLSPMLRKSNKDMQRKLDAIKE